MKIKVEKPIKKKERWIGKKVPQVLSNEKVTGKLKYPSDIYLENMLWGAVVRSKYPHAVIKKIDATKAENFPGVVKVLTWKDIPGVNGFGIVVQDQPVLCKDKVRYVGDAVALIAAETRETLSKAKELVEVEYEVLPPVTDPFVAMRDDAPKVHRDGNIHLHTVINKGDINKGFGEADLIIENEYRTGRQEHAYLETESGVAYYDEDTDLLTVWCGGQYAFRDQAQIARVLALDPRKVRVIANPLGGGFGGKDEITTQIHLALLTYLTKRPVKMVISREESMIFSWKRHPMILKYRTGVKKDGTLIANEVYIYADTGAYASLGGPVVNLAVEHSCGPYRIPNTHIEGFCIYTNNGVSGAFRGFGVNQVTFAMESQMDEIARKLNMDPVELRRKNILKRGEETGIGSKIETSMGLDIILKEMENSSIYRDRAKEENLDKKPWIKRGVGVAISYQGTGLGVGLPDYGSAWIEMRKDGGFNVFAGNVDVGQGLQTSFKLIALETLCLRDERKVHIITGDTHLTPDSGTSTASAGTYRGGKAIRMAGIKMIDLLKKHASRMLGENKENLEIEDGTIFVKDNPDRRISYEELGEILFKKGRLPKTEGHFYFPTSKTKIPGAFGLPHYIFSFSGSVALVEVNTLTGKVNLVKAVNIIDGGKVINKLGFEGQSEGGIVMGMGYALTEDTIIKDGYFLTKNLSTYIIPTIKDAPKEIETIPVETYEELGPFGEKGIGETVMVPIAPAITNGIFDAVGVRIRQIPATPERVFWAIRKRENK
ncbi:MAG: xanthine dehydrogenase family protein molybdopterin-binding subunit [Caldiserica bacterium]|nr:MAG: xanthine dehydrogenase family protein molybdopterin-binding subunit [Caldisericota bacterium]